MATEGQRYDAPNCTVTREVHANNITGVASTSIQKILFFQKCKLMAAHSLVITAGTHAAAGVDILNGTTSVGEITHGTDAANSINTSGYIGSEISANGYVDIKGKANSSTMVNSYTLEIQVLQDAVHTIS